jgi:hypothetical protein
LWLNFYPNYVIPSPFDGLSAEGLGPQAGGEGKRKDKPMPNNFKETLQELIREVSNNPSLPSDQKVKFLGDLQKLATPLQSDRWIYRLVVACLGLTVLLTVLGGFYLSIKTAATIPEGLIALGSAAVGALAGLLAPSPMK